MGRSRAPARGLARSPVAPTRPSGWSKQAADGFLPECKQDFDLDEVLGSTRCGLHGDEAHLGPLEERPVRRGQRRGQKAVFGPQSARNAPIHAWEVEPTLGFEPRTCCLRN
jgi:hypothetical protein